MSLKLNKSLFKVEKDFKFITISIVIGLLSFIVLFFAYIVLEIIKFGGINFKDYGTRMVLLISITLAYGISFLLLEIYLIIRSIGIIGSMNKRYIVLKILGLILIHIVFILLQALVIILSVMENHLCLIIATIVILIPYAFLFIKKVKFDKSRISR